MGELKYSRMDFLFTCAGLAFFLLDIGLDIYAAVSFYEDKDYVYLGILLLFLLGSSLLVQIYSWLFYSYDNFDSCLSQSNLTMLHVFQLGIFFRCYEFLRVATGCFSLPVQEDIAEYLSHDLGFLRLIETFSESAPQLVLMLTIILQQGYLDTETVLKAVWSASAIAVSVTMYQRSMRSFLPAKKMYTPFSLVLCFLWNFLLISSRLAALALFASVLPFFIVIHFVCSWIVLFFFACRSKTEFMDKPCGEWLYRATVGLIWYFHWFNLVEGRTICRTLLYHGYILADIVLLCSLWYWKMITDPPYFKIPQFYAVIIAPCVVSIHILGLLFKLLHYKRYHQNLVNGNITTVGVTDHGMPSSPELGVKRYNKRMRKLAENFYASNQQSWLEVESFNCSFCP